MKFKMKQVVLSIALIGVVSSASATQLNALSPTSSVDVVASSFGGTLLDSAITNISNISYNGIARSAVYDTGTGLDFYYQFSNNISSQNGVERFTGYDFSSLGNSVVNVFQTGSAFGIFTAGTEVADGADRTLGGVIGFSFIPNSQSKINPGTTSFTEIIRTNARNYKPGNFGLLDGLGDNAAGFQPTAPVPEPEALSLMLSGIGMLGFIGRRRLAKGATELFEKGSASLSIA